MGKFFDGSYFVDEDSPVLFKDTEAALNAAADGSAMATVNTCDLFMLCAPGYFSTSLISREHAQELAQFILDATGAAVHVRQVRIGFDICHEANIAEGWVDDSSALQAKEGTEYCRLLQEAEAQQADGAEV